MKPVEGRCPIHGTAICPVTGGSPSPKDCKECRIAIERIRRGETQYVAEKALEEHLLDRALRGVRKSLRHAATG